MTVSICIPTYNQALYLEQAILSSAQQSSLPVEIIVSNDCSTDNTAELLQKLAVQIPFLKIMNQKQNLGIAKNTDACLRMAKGDFIVRLDSDDYLSPEYVEKLSNLLIKYPNAGYAHASVQEIDQHGKFLGQRKLYRNSGFQSGTDGLKAAIHGYRVAANILMFRKEALVKVDYIHNRPDYVEDYHLSASLAAAGFGNVYLHSILSFYRVWIDTGRTRQRRKLMEIVGVYKVFEEVLKPSFESRGWNVKVLNKKKAILACTHADCLGWDVYTYDEKQELTQALTKLSSSTITKVYIWLYSKGFGTIITFYRSLWVFPKNIFKTLLLNLKS